MTSMSSRQDEHVAKRKEPGVSWKENEEHVLPKNRLGIVSFALVCTMFLGALDHVSAEASSLMGASNGEIARLLSQLHSPLS